MVRLQVVFFMLLFTYDHTFILQFKKQMFLKIDKKMACILTESKITA